MLVGDDHGVKIRRSHPDPFQTSFKLPGAQTGIDEKSNPRGGNVDAVPLGAAGQYGKVYTHFAHSSDAEARRMK
jgi:hypothetical protein